MSGKTPGRGRARTRTSERSVERPQYPSGASQQSTQQQQPARVSPPTPPTRGSPPTPPSPPSAAVQEVAGRGRGREAPERKPGEISSPSEAGEESPPTQTFTAGRAALRGKQVTVVSGTTTGLVGEMAKLELEEREGKKKTREYRPEPVPRLRMPGMNRKEDLMGTSGVEVKVFANYFMIDTKLHTVFQHYHVDFDPPVERKKYRIELVKEHDHMFPNNKAFDGMNLYSVDKLANDETIVTSVRQPENQEVKIKIRRVGELSINSPQFQMLLGIVFRKCLGKLGLKEIQRNFYDMRTGRQVERYNIQILDGFATAIGTYEYAPQISRIMLNADVSHRVMNNRSAYDIMSDLYNRYENDQAKFRQSVTQELVGTTVMATYTFQTYRIDDIDWDGAPTDKFETSSGNKISFIQYYQQQYRVTIQEPMQPLLISRPSIRARRRGDTRPIKLIPELCLITGLSERMRGDAMMMRDLARETSSKPDQRLNSIVRLVRNINTKPETISILNEWQTHFIEQPVEVQARRLESEILKFGGEVNKRLSEKADWSNDLKNVRHISAVPIHNWVVFHPQRDRSAADAFLDALFRAIGKMGMEVDDPKVIELANDRNDSYINGLRQHVNRDTQLVVCILPRPRKDLYDAIKRYCCIDFPVLSQCILTKNLNDPKKLMGVMTKVAVQMNCKLGGEIWAVSIPLPNVMICGIDTYHDSQNKSQSVCAFVATVNQLKTRFFSRATHQRTHQELSDNLCLSIRSALAQYYKINRTYPDKIVIYRDGVSDGELQTVKFQEVNQILEAVRVKEDYSPKLGFVVVKKRGNARFFEEKQKGLIENPGCGTVIDNTVTRPDWYDFYLVPQHVTQGTVNPTHFNIIYDNTGLKPDHYQKLSFKLCHMYYNWPGAIRVPAVCQYAHKLAFLVGQSLHKEHHISLSDKLYYL